MMLFYLLPLFIVVFPAVAFLLLYLIGKVKPEIRRKGIRQLGRPFIYRSESPSEFALHKQRRSLENEVIRKYPPHTQK